MGGKRLSKIRKDELASNISLWIWMEKLGKTEDQWHASKNPVFDIANIYDHAHADILCRTHILPSVPRSAFEAEIEQEFDTGDLINQGKWILQAMGYPQQVNIILADNMTSIDFCKQSD